MHITCAILKLVAAYAVEAELGALLLNGQDGTPPTTDTYTRRQHHHGRNYQQHDYTPMTTCYGTTLFIATVPSSSENARCQPAHRRRKPEQLPE